jgi:hypothetical protein
MTCRNAPFKVKQIEKLAQIAPLPAHHGKPPHRQKSQQTESLFAENHAPFFNGIDPTVTFQCRLITTCSVILPESRMQRRRALPQSGQSCCPIQRPKAKSCASWYSVRGQAECAILG